MLNDLIRFEDENFEPSLDAYSRDFTREPQLTFASFNMSMSRVQGVGPRYGLTPLYTHSQAFTRATGAGGVIDYGGERQLAQTPSGVVTGVHMKKKSIGLVPIKIGSVVYYFHVFTKNDVSTGEDSAITYVDCSTGIGSFTSTDREAGSGLNSIIYTQRAPHKSAYLKIERNTLSGDFNAPLSNVRKIPEDLNSASVVTYTSSGKLYQMNNLIGYVSDNTKAHADFSTILSADGYRIGTGVISDMVDLKYPIGKRTITVNTLVLDGVYSCFTLKDRNIYVETVSNLAASPTFSAKEAATDMNLASSPTVVGRVDGSAAYAAATIKYSYIENNFLRHNSAFKAIFVAAKKPVCYLIQDAVNLRAYTGLGRNMFQYYPLTESPLYPKTQTTFAVGTATYKEFQVSKQTSFFWWPSFNGSALANNAATPRAVDAHVTLGAAGSGLLRANRDYELTYSFFDKSIDYETNVGVPVKFRVGTADFVAISLFRQVGGPATPLQQTILGTTSGIETPVRYSFEQITDQYSSVLLLNHLEIRFYYREVGQQTWFPALFMDASKYFGDPNHDIIWACATPIGGLPGGEPGGFNDYSPLPNDEYTEVQVFQERVFWLSANNLVFSRKRNPFAYSIYNNVSIPENKFNGMVIHQFDGQSYQTSRLCIFGAQQYYSGVMKGAGYGVEVPVSLSDGTTAAYELDGSDFEVSFRYNATAFSGRSACVADGILYFWGPKGIFRDDGVSSPKKISKILEPDILSLYAHQYTDRIHCIFNEASREIIWFYVKNETTVLPNTTWALAYHIEKGAFYNLYFPFVVDWARDLQREDSSADAAINKLGDKRTLVAVRQTATDASSTFFYFDSLNKTGDMYPGKDLHIWKCDSQGNNVYRLFLPEAYGASAIVGIAAGDKVSICQSLAYQGPAAPLGTTSIDGIYVVNATGSGNDGLGNTKYYIDVISRTLALPNFTAESLTTSGLTVYPYMIPMYHQGNNGITYNLQSRLWAPAGLKFWGIWLKGHLLFKVDLLTSSSVQTTTFSYASNVSASLLSNTVTLTDNQGSTGYSQRLVALNGEYGATQGQAIRFKLSGTHFGGSWQLVSLAFEVMAQDPTNIKQFEE